ncbi:hypothetical protein [Kaarinaea lacus]
MSANIEKEKEDEIKRLQVERDRIELDMAKLEFSQKKMETLWSKNFSSIITAGVSIVAVITSAVFSSLQVERVTNLEIPLKVQEQKTQAARFVMDNKSVIVSGTTDEQELLKGIMKETFKKEVNDPVFLMIAKNARNVDTMNVFNPTPTEPSKTTELTRKVFLQYNDQKDKEIVDSIVGAALSEKGYNVPGSQRVIQQTSGDIRYFHESDKSAASDIETIVEKSLADKGITKDIKLIPLIGRYKNVPEGVFEVWLPPLTKSDSG